MGSPPRHVQASCFAMGTLVHTDTGWQEIDRISVGNLVLSRSEITGEQAYRRVVSTHEHYDKEVYYVYYSTENGQKEVLTVTPEQSFWVRDIGWMQVGQLLAGQMLEICDFDGRDPKRRPGGLEAVLAGRLSGGRWVAKVDNVQKAPGLRAVYNLEVEDFHTYFVGGLGVWVHNKSDSPVAAFEKRKTNAD